MQKSLIDSQLSNIRTCTMYRNRCFSLAKNVFNIKNLNDFIDKAFLNRILVEQGAIAFFKDDELGLLALPFIVKGKLDVYGRPLEIEVHSATGYKRNLKQDEFIIMWDNTDHITIFQDILQYVARLALCERTSDINISQQKTPRVWKTKTENEQSIKHLLNHVDSFENQVITYEKIDLDDTQAILAPAPYVADKIDMHKEKIWNEFLCFIGIANMNVEKKERLIKDEVTTTQGGTIASRFSRYETRKEAIEKINKKWNLNLEVEYYDGLPTTMKEPEGDIIEGDDEDVSME